MFYTGYFSDRLHEISKKYEKTGIAKGRQDVMYLAWKLFRLEKMLPKIYGKANFSRCLKDAWGSV